jgi:hypothetical protein
MRSQALVENVVHLDKENRALKARIDDLQGGRPQSISERRQVEGLHEQFAPLFDGLEAPPPAPLNSESPYTYRRRMLAELAGEIDQVNRRRAAAENRNLSEDERRINGWAKNGRVYEWDSTLAANFGAEIIGAAERLAADPLQGSFREPGKLRELVSRENGHTHREWRGDNSEWLRPFQHQGQVVRSGTLVDAAMGRLPHPAPRPRPAPPPPALSSADISALVAQGIADGLRSLLPGRRAGRQK